ncbi:MULTISPECIES: hypothetical protein [unclassified Microcoleus]|uniref:hypothetical protein n=1 Tax=unclassified Microcoleus TaxID=2642155 RepID=UPI002FD159EC
MSCHAIGEKSTACQESPARDAVPALHVAETPLAEVGINFLDLPATDEKRMLRSIRTANNEKNTLLMRPGLNFLDALLYPRPPIMTQLC